VAELFKHLQSAFADRYTLERELGRGGMATVYLAQDRKHHRRVALKVLHPELAYALGADRFLREIEVAANLTHPHILPLHDSGEIDSLLYYVMPYIEGESVRDRLRRETQLPIEDALQIAREVADALAYAHGQGVVHRDIKPENILLSAGHALVADFGIARALWQADGGRLTETGLAVGTAAYMSPEQASGERQLDGRSDVYSLGCVLYEMLAGEPPYTGPTPQAIMAKRFSDPVPRVRRVRPTVPEAVEQSVLKALAPVPADRFATAEQFAQMLAGRVATISTVGPATPAAMPPPVDALTVASPGKRVRAWRTVASAFVLGLLTLAALALLLRQRVPDSANTGVADAAGPRRLAVLPFENLGDSADAYFADGVTDAVRGKLVALPGLQVTARGSSSQYRGSTKTPQQIGRELGVQYLLTATVRWEKVGDGTSRVQVTPELVQVATASTKWQQPFDAALTGVFEVQAEIAGRVAQALDVELADSARRQLAERPTQSLAAYDAYLKGEEVSQSLGAADPVALRRAVAYYAQAVALDSSFVQAWAQLSRAYSSLYVNGTPTPAEAKQAHRAAERALALAPHSAEGYLAMGIYYRLVAKDHKRAAKAFGQGETIAPTDPRLLRNSGITELTLGRWEAALAHLQQAQTLDPRSGSAAGNLTRTLLLLRRYPEARVAAERALVLAPTNLPLIINKAMISLAQGDLAGARVVLDATPKEVDPAVLVAFFATYQDLYWVLDDAEQRLLLGLSPSAFDNDRALWGLVRAQTFWLRGEQAAARLYADSARIALQGQLRDSPEDAQRRMLYGLALAHLGRKTDAIREGGRGVALLPVAKDSYDGPYLQHQFARIYILLGEPEKALDQLEPLLKIPYYLSPGWLKIDPTFDPLRGNPRFERLVEGKPSSA
jgi:serine/threonine-protein kinase